MWERQAKGPPKKKTKMSAFYENYVKCVDELTAAITSKKDIPFERSNLNRYASYACMLLCCGPCCMWSGLLRLVACPAACFVKGPAHMCSNNGCTAISDMCIEGYVDAVRQRRHLPLLDGTAPPLGDRDRALMADAIGRVRVHFDGAPKFNAVHYMLVRHVAEPIVAAFGGSAAFNGGIFPGNASKLLEDVQIAMRGN